MDGSELGGFLRSRRARVRPADAGFADGGRRRTPGLRRAEVALLAGISVDYYVRLEQGRGPRPSAQVLTALGRALRLTADERDYLLRLGAPPPPERAAAGPDVPATVRRLLDRLDDVPALAIDARYDLVAWNAMLVALIGDPAELPPARRNRLRLLFDGPSPAAARLPDLAAQVVADVRASGRYPADPGLRDLVDGLRARSPGFAELWERREVEARRSITKRTVHPVVGELELDCEILAVPGGEHRVLIYTAEPGTASAEALRRLARQVPVRSEPPGEGRGPGLGNTG